MYEEVALRGAFFEDFDWNQKDNTYAKRCTILSGLLFILKVLFCRF